MLKRLSHLFLFALLGGAAFSCSQVYYKLFSIKILKEFDANDYFLTLDHFFDLYKGEVYTVISSDSLFREFQRDFEMLGDKNVIQPIQMLYFRGDSLISYRANCHAYSRNWSGNLNWNYYGAFDLFPPKPAISLGNERPSLKALSKIYDIRTAIDGYTIVFFWTNMLKRQSSEAYQTLTKNINTTDQLVINIINIDKFYIALNE